MKPKFCVQAWLGLISIVLAAGILVWLSPPERTLGDGIKVVYVHVSFTWAGMVGFNIAGLFGLFMLFTNKRILDDWNQVISWVAWSWFAMGFLLSLWAAKVNWGIIYWREPRVLAAMQFLIVALLVLMANRFLSSIRLRGALSALLAFMLMWSLLGAPLVMHPKSPIRESSSGAIQLTFLGMFIFSSLAASWFVWYFRKRLLVGHTTQS